MENTTPFSVVYDDFLSKITEDMYMELNEKDTYQLLEELLISSIYKFEFPRVDIFNYVLKEDTEKKDKLKTGYFNVILTREEINILSTYMIVEWLGQQLASVENTRMKYSGNDFKFTSQANHMSKILTLKKDYEREGFHLQRLIVEEKKMKKVLCVQLLILLWKNLQKEERFKRYENKYWRKNKKRSNYRKFKKNN